MINYKLTHKATKRLSSFSDDEWETADLQYYGRKINWEKKISFIHAYDKEKIVGLLEMTMEAGVMHILDLVIDHDHQRQGIGTTLIKKAEELAREHQIHKIFLETGKDWGVRKFYEDLGYKKTGDLPKHFAKQDYVEYSKFL